jgi:hypothetical protein
MHIIKRRTTDVGVSSALLESQDEGSENEKIPDQKKRKPEIPPVPRWIYTVPAIFCIVAITITFYVIFFTSSEEQPQKITTRKLPPSAIRLVSKRQKFKNKFERDGLSSNFFSMDFPKNLAEDLQIIIILRSQPEIDVKENFQSAQETWIKEATRLKIDVDSFLDKDLLSPSLGISTT